MFDFQNLEVYKKSKQFHIGCKQILAQTKTDKYVHDQLSRASYSVVLNFAEGSAKSSKSDRKNFFKVSRGSLFECVAVLDILNDQKLVPKKTYLTQLSLADEISRMLYSMIRNLTS